MKTPGSRIRILCVDDHTIVREGISALLRDEPDMEVVASVANGRDAIDAYRRSRPDVVLMDLQLPGMSGFEAIRQIRREDANARIVVLTMHHAEEDVHRAMQAGAAGYLLKDTLADKLIRFIREAHAGKATSPLMEGSQFSQRIDDVGLTEREVQVIQLLAEGMRNKEIGSSLGITEGTVQTHIKSIFAKLHVHDRTAALAAALQRGIIYLDR
jgi:DNA-binding NarL/FixJ family response regulator